MTISNFAQALATLALNIGFQKLRTAWSWHIGSHKEPLDQSDCWKLFVQL